MDLKSSDSIVPQSFICTIMKRNFKQWWSTISPKPTKVTTILTHWIVNTKNTRIYDIGNPGGLGQSQECGIAGSCWKSFSLRFIHRSLLNFGPLEWTHIPWTMHLNKIKSPYHNARIPNFKLHVQIPLMVPKDKEFFSTFPFTAYIIC